MNIVYFHGLGGCAEDWAEVSKKVPGQALTISALADNFVDTCAQFAERLRVQNDLVLCGYSLGGRVALQVAAQIPERVRGLVLLGSGLGLATMQEREERIRSDEVWAKKVLENPDQFWREWYGQALFSNMKNAPETALSSWIQRRKHIDPLMVAGQFRALSLGAQPDQRELLKKLPISTLYIAGELDKKYSSSAQELQNYPQVQAELIPGVGHVLPLEAPEEISLRLKNFLHYLETKNGKKHR